MTGFGIDFKAFYNCKNMLLVGDFSWGSSSSETMSDIIVTAIEIERTMTKMNDSWSKLVY